MLSDISTATQAVLAAVAPSVVAVGRDGRGTGFVVAPNRVLTNAHNLRDATTLVTFADGRAVQGTLHGADRAGDLAVLDVDTGSIAPLTWAEESPGVGDVVFAVSRGGHRARITFGILSAVGAPFSGPRGRIVQAGIEHTAPLPRGSSGGPLTNAQGAVLGVNTHRIGEGFYVARPFDQALRARVVELIEGRTVEPRALGVALAPADVAAKLRRSVGLPARVGLLVRQIDPEGRGAAGGLMEGDLLVSAAGTMLVTPADLHAALDAVGAAGTEELLELGIVRGAQEMSLTISFVPVSAE